MAKAPNLELRSDKGTKVPRLKFTCGARTISVSSERSVWAREFPGKKSVNNTIKAGTRKMPPLSFITLR